MVPKVLQVLQGLDHPSYHPGLSTPVFQAHLVDQLDLLHLVVLCDLGVLGVPEIQMIQHLINYISFQLIIIQAVFQLVKRAALFQIVQHHLHSTEHEMVYK